MWGDIPIIQVQMMHTNYRSKMFLSSDKQWSYTVTLYTTVLYTNTDKETDYLTTLIMHASLTV